MTLHTILYNVECTKIHSMWIEGVVYYAITILEPIIDRLGEDTDFNEASALEQVLLNGSKDWNEYSYSGRAKVCDEDIASTLCTCIELERTDNGRKAPNQFESWFDVQARALSQAWQLIKNILENEE